MFDFEKALVGDRGSIPVHEASSFFLEVRSPIKTAAAAGSMSKTAGWQDAPDETGSLEGAFSVPVEQALPLMGNCVNKLMRLMNASIIYGSSIRGDYAAEVKNAMCGNDWEHKDALQYIIERMSVLAGAPHIPEPDLPPPSVEPIPVAKRMIRAEQEMLVCYQELCAVLGDNPMSSRIKQYMGNCQSHLDNYWRCLPQEHGGLGLQGESNEVATAAPVPGADVPAVAAPAAEEGGEELEEDPPETEETEEAPADEGEEKTASAITKIAAAMVKWAMEGDDELKEKGRQRAVTNTASEHSREKSRRGERAGKVLGTLAGLGTGAVAGKKLVGGRLGTLGGAALGAGAGKALGHELGTEVDIARGKTAAAERGWGEAIGETVGGIGGGAAGGLAGAIPGIPAGPAALATGAAGMTAGSMAGGAAGGALGKKIDQILAAKKSPELAKAASAMVAWVKKADTTGMEAEAPMASPTGQQEMEPLNYMQAEQLGRAAQEANEADFHKQRADSAEQQAAQVMQEATQQVAATQQENAQLSAEAQMADARVQEALGEAMTAKDQAVAQTEAAARIRMGQQDLRMQLMGLAAQEPDMAAALQAAGQEQQAQVPYDPEADPAAQPGEVGEQAQEAERAQADAAEQTAQVGQTAQNEAAQQQNKMAQVIPLFSKKAGALGATLGGVTGAGVSAFGTAKKHKEGVGPAQEQVTELSEKQDGTFAQAAALARAKKDVADRELQQAHPGRVLAGNTVKGAYRGAVGGSALENNLSYLMR